MAKHFLAESSLPNNDGARAEFCFFFSFCRKTLAAKSSQAGWMAGSCCQRRHRHHLQRLVLIFLSENKERNSSNFIQLRKESSEKIGVKILRKF